MESTPGTPVTTFSFPHTHSSRLSRCRTEARERGIVVETQSDLYDEDEDIDEATLSDLEDADPDCSDIIVAQFESVSF